MFRFPIIAAALLLSAGEALAHGHESSAAPPPPPPPKSGTKPLPAQVVFTQRGAMLADPKGMTLYYFDKDDSGNKSNCNAKCTERWIPFSAPADAQASGDFTVIIRSDGSKMWAYRYRPLYTSQQDKAPGDVNGVDPSNLWHIARPAP
jgi:predicted lipoprotein with Yx(FWY)xxD motif